MRGVISYFCNIILISNPTLDNTHNILNKGLAWQDWRAWLLSRSSVAKYQVQLLLGSIQVPPVRTHWTLSCHPCRGASLPLHTENIWYLQYYALLFRTMSLIPMSMFPHFICFLGTFSSTSSLTSNIGYRASMSHHTKIKLISTFWMSFIMTLFCIQE